MTPEQIHDLWDTVFKIGLGAFIAGFFSVFGIILNHRFVIKKDRRKRRVEAFDFVDNAIDAYVFELGDFLVKVRLFYEKIENIDYKSDEFGTKLKDLTLSERDSLANVYKNAGKAIMKLQLLNKRKAAEEISYIINYGIEISLKIEEKKYKHSISYLKKEHEKIVKHFISYQKYKRKFFYR